LDLKSSGTELNMKYKSVIVTARGGPEVLKVVEYDLNPPGPDKARIKILASQVCAPDITARYGQSPFIPKPPYTPGYAFIGIVDAIGPGVEGINIGDRVAALTAYGSYAEFIEWDADQLIPVPESLDPAEAVPLILNYIVAYHVMHRWAKVKTGDKVLIIGASGGIGTALLQLGSLAGLKMYGVASASKHDILTEYGATPIDYHTQDFVDVLKDAEPHGLNAVFEGMAGDYFKRAFSVLGHGGTIVGYGNPLSITGMFKVLGRVALYTLLPNGRSAKYYSTGIFHLNWDMFLEDWAELFRLMEVGKIKPVIAARFPLLEAAQANQMLEDGQVIGNIVLEAAECQQSQLLT
jgi:NADPH:quinone reductase-like Zn-dependent oxidoreductase